MVVKVIRGRELKGFWGHVALLLCVLGVMYGLSRIPSVVLWRKPKETAGFYMFGADWANAQPVLLEDAPSEFLVTKEERFLYPIGNFAFRLTTERGFLIDTYSGLAGKDNGAQGDTVVAATFSAKAIEEIYNAALAIRVFDYPEPRLPYGCNNFDGHSVGEITLTVRSGSAVKTFAWHAGNRFCGSNYDAWVRLYRLVEMMMSAGRTSEAYLALPRGKACYP
jgi:hypothetical protein